MGRKKKSDVPEAPRPNAGWIYETEIQINGRHVVKGTELKISKERGRFRFIHQVTTDKGVTWIDVVGGPKGYEVLRSFAPERIKTVHYKNKTDHNLAVEHKEKKKIIKAAKAEEISSEDLLD